MQDEDINNSINEKYLDQLYKIYSSSTETSDKNFLFISSGALGLSVTFLKNIVDINNIKCFFILVISWSLLTISILLSLILHRNSIKFIDYLIVNAYQTSTEVDLKASKMRSKAETISTLTIWTLIVGISLLVLFVLLNVRY
jgi:hypothetical protein